MLQRGEKAYQETYRKYTIRPGGNKVWGCCVDVFGNIQQQGEKYQFSTGLLCGCIWEHPAATRRPGKREDGRQEKSISRRSHQAEEEDKESGRTGGKKKQNKTITRSIKDIQERYSHASFRWRKTISQSPEQLQIRGAIVL